MKTTLLATLMISLAGVASAECTSSRNREGTIVIVCPEYREITPSNPPVQRSRTQTTTVYTYAPSGPYGGYSTGVTEAPREVPALSNQELTRELQERYKPYGGYREGYTLKKGADGKSFLWYK